MVRLASASYPRSIEQGFAVGAVGAAGNHQGPALDGPVVVVGRRGIAKTALKIVRREPVGRTCEGEVARCARCECLVFAWGIVRVAQCDQVVTFRPDGPRAKGWVAVLVVAGYRRGAVEVGLRQLALEGPQQC